MRKLILLFMAQLFFTAGYAQYSGGSGTEGDPYQIATTADLLYLSNSGSGDMGSYFIQTADLSFDADETLVDWDGSGSAGDGTDSEGFVPIGTFTGSYDGQGYTIYNVYINRGSSGQGLFGTVDGGTLKNIYCSGFEITSSGQSGTLIGTLSGASLIEQCKAENSTTVGTGFYTSGFIGYATGGTVNECYVNANVTATGKVYNGIFVGRVNGATTFNNCYSRGDINSGDRTGGFSGRTLNATFNYCYAAATIQGDTDGGFSGRNEGGNTFLACFYDNTLVTGAGDSYTASTPIGITGTSTTDMKTGATFTNAGWDFTGETTNGPNDYWEISTANDGYPDLTMVIGGVVYSTDNTLSSLTASVGILSPSFDPGTETYDLYVAPGTASVDLTAVVNDETASAVGDGTIVLSAGSATASIVVTAESGAEKTYTVNISETAAAFSGGSGLENDPYQIANTADLIALSQETNLSFYYIQTADISFDADETAVDWDASGSVDAGVVDNGGFSPIGNSTDKFTGIYDGQGFTISNIYMSRSSNEQALFGRTDGATIKNVNCDGFEIAGGAGSGVLVGKAEGGSVIENCSAINASITPSANYSGGFIGELAGASSLSNCYADIDVISAYYGGVLAARVGSASITNCYALGTVSGQRVGGLIGFSDNATVSNCYAAVEVTGTANLGGLVGRVYSSGNNFSNCFYDQTLFSGGSDGYGSNVGTGKTTAEMKTRSTFRKAGWDFAVETTNGTDDIWAISATSNDGYPNLAGESNALITYSDGSWSNGTGPTAVDDALIDDALVITGDLSVNNIDVSAGVSVTIMSGGSLAVMDDATGDATIVRNTTGNGGYSIVGAAVSGADLSSLSANYLYDYDGTDWVAMTSGSMASGKGYFAGYDGVGEVVLSGALVSGNVSATVSTAGDGFNILSNPYTAAITAQDVLDSDAYAQATTGAVYIWDDGGANNGADRVGTYAVVNNIGSNDFATIGSVQGFFVQAANGGSIDFTPSMQSTSAGANADGNYYRKASNSEKQVLKLSISGNELYHETTVGFVADATFGRDYGYDAQFLQGNDLIAFYSMLDDEKMAIQGLPQQENIEVQLGMDLKEAGDYKVSVEKLSGFGDLTVVLVDTETGLFYNLSENSDVPFTTEEVVNTKRFKVVVSPAKVLSVVDLKTKVQVLGDDAELTINYASNKSELVRIYSLDGRSVFNSEVTFANNQAVIAPQINRNQVYVLRVNDQAIKFVLK